MSIVVVVRKNGKTAIAADTMTSFGSTKIKAQYLKKRSKIYRCGDSYLGVCGAAGHNNVVNHLVNNYADNFNLNSKEEIFETVLSLHPVLKDEYFINTSEGENDTYESSQLEYLIANPFGIFGVYSWREVYEFDRFHATGSGMDYALGAMYAVYETLEDARQIAEIGVRAACEFDEGCELPIDVYSINLVNQE